MDYINENPRRRVFIKYSVFTCNLICYAISVPMMSASIAYFLISEEPDFSFTLSEEHEYDIQTERAKKRGTILFIISFVLLVIGMITSVILCACFCACCCNSITEPVYEDDEMDDPGMEVASQEVFTEQPTFQNVQMMSQIVTPDAQMVQMPVSYTMQNIPTMHPQYGYDQPKQEVV